MDCEKYQELIYLALYGEIDEATKRALKKHLDRCPVCAAEQARAEKLFGFMEKREQPEVDPELLKSYRNQLIAHLQVTKKRPSAVSVDWSRVSSFFRAPVLRVVYATALLAVGVVVGRFECSSGPTVTQIKAGQMASLYQESEIPELIKEGQLRNMDLELLPDQQVQVSFQGTRDYKVTGGTLDNDIKELMAYILLNEQNDGLRMRTVETLSGQPDSLVSQMLLYSLLHDGNPGVRLKSIRALREYPAIPQLRDAYMKVLMTDYNPAVRIEAMEGLTDFILEVRVREVITIAAEKDSNDYIKLLANNALLDFEREPELNGTAIEELR